MIEGLRLCRDCKWMAPKPFLAGVYDIRCRHHVVSPVKADLVTGSTKQKMEWCSSARCHENLPCGTSGKLWEAR